MITSIIIANLYNAKNTRDEKIAALIDIKEIFTDYFRWKIQKHTIDDLNKQVHLYVLLRIKWLGFCIRTGINENEFPVFMSAAYPHEIDRVVLELNKQKPLPTLLDVLS